jgi:ABC-type sulfate transport system permease component
MRWLPLLAGALLVAGFLDLALGGAAVGAVLLVAGYCVGVPAAILAGRLPTRQRAVPRRLPG